ncbi:MAG: hypothetical protein Ct9H90mP16_21290 [Candidatus Poseidoniales archaeon]|nr:MAG: hypothetical protein Ct9H90mP16_21290 [Candidatus Poseidoniales archaeon]
MPSLKERRIPSRLHSESRSRPSQWTNRAKPPKLKKCGSRHSKEKQAMEVTGAGVSLLGPLFD